MCATWMCKVKITPKSTKKKINLKAVVMMHYTLHFPPIHTTIKVGVTLFPFQNMRSIFSNRFPSI